MKEVQRKRWSGTHSNYKVEWLKDPDFKGLLQKYTGNGDLIIASAARSPSEMYTIPTDTEVH